MMKQTGEGSQFLLYDKLIFVGESDTWFRKAKQWYRSAEHTAAVKEGLIVGCNTYANAVQLL